MNGACCQSMARAIRKARATSSMPPPGSSTTCASSVMVVARCRSLVSKTRFSLAQANRTGGGSSFYRRSRVNGTESSLTLCWRKTDSNHRSRRQRDGLERGPAPNHRRRGRRPVLNDPSSLSVRHLRSATAERPFCESGTEGSNPVSSSRESSELFCSALPIRGSAKNHGGSRPRPCKNVREPRKRRTVFSIAFFGCRRQHFWF